MTPDTYREFLISRWLEYNEFGNTKDLLKAIDAANAIPAEARWSDRKAAFNAIAEKAPLKNDESIYCLTHADIPAALDSELFEFRYFGQMSRFNKRQRKAAKASGNKRQAPT